METCNHCGRPAWVSTGGMGGSVMPDSETHCLRHRGRDCRIAHEGRASVFHDASPEEIRVLSGLLRAMRETASASVRDDGWEPRSRGHALHSVASAQEYGQATPRVLANGAWHIALALDALENPR